MAQKLALIWCANADIEIGRQVAAGYARPTWRTSYRNPLAYNPAEPEVADLHLVVGEWPTLVAALEGQQVALVGAAAPPPPPPEDEPATAAQPYHMHTGGGWYAIFDSTGAQVDRVKGKAEAGAAVAALGA